MNQTYHVRHVQILSSPICKRPRDFCRVTLAPSLLLEAVADFPGECLFKNPRDETAPTNELILFVVNCEQAESVLTIVVENFLKVGAGLVR